MHNASDNRYLQCLVFVDNNLADYIITISTIAMVDILYSILLLLLHTHNAGLVSTILSTVERRYHFSSTAAGFIPSIYEITLTLV